MNLSESFALALLRRAPPLLLQPSTAHLFKLGLIRVLGFCSGPAGPPAKELLMSVLVQNPAEAFVVRCLDSLSRITARSFQDVDAQMDLLLGWLKSDERPLVQVAAIRGLALLVRKSPVHLHRHLPSVLALITAYQRLERRHDNVLAALLALLAFQARHCLVSKVWSMSMDTDV
jgi:hypothetical protein